MSKQDYEKIVFIGGNHDNELIRNPPTGMYESISYLQDSGTEFRGMKIWGSPWTAKFYDQNPSCMAFSMDWDQLKEKWDLIPNDTDILITHSPPEGILDYTYHKSTGCQFLRSKINKLNPKLHVFGHIHECGGQIMAYTGMTCVNAAIVDQNYKHVSGPVSINLT
jgi:Icc-related predicted phosphoesterase